MKKIIPFIVVAIVSFSSCKKENEQVASRSAVAGEPSIISVKAYPVYAGANESAAFDVSLIADSNYVSRLDLYEVPNLKRASVYKPVTGKYTMYDHVGDYTRGASYFFVFTKTDGTKITSDIFELQ